jgi:hypothetical protein
MVRGGVVFFAFVFGLGFALGTVRQLLMGIGLGRQLLVVAEIPIMLAFAWWAAGWCARRFGVAASTAARLGMGLVMLILLRLGELGVGVYLMDQTVRSHFGALTAAAGAAETLPQILAALFPLIRARLTGR